MSSPLAEAFAASSELSDSKAQMTALEKIIADPAADVDALAVKEQAVVRLGELLAEHKLADKIIALVASLRPFFAQVAKAKTAKIVRTLIDQLAKIPGTSELQMQLCRDSIAWCKAEKRSFLRQRIEAKLGALLLEAKKYTEALALLEELLREVKRCAAHHRRQPRVRVHTHARTPAHT